MADFDNSKLEKIFAVESAEALQALAKENGIEMSDEDAKISFEQIKNGMSELKDEDLDKVAGGLRDSALNLEPTSLRNSLALENSLAEANVGLTIGNTSTNLRMAVLMNNISTNKCLLELMHSLVI